MAHVLDPGFAAGVGIALGFGALLMGILAELGRSPSVAVTRPAARSTDKSTAEVLIVARRDGPDCLL
jgi:hypothetical protein